MPRNRPDNRIHHAGQVRTPGNIGQPISDGGREFRAFPPSDLSVGMIARRIVEEDAPRYRRLKLVIREDPTLDTFDAGGFDRIGWHPVIIEVRNGGNRALSRFRVACCNVQRPDGSRESWSAVAWVRQIAEQTRTYEGTRMVAGFRFNRPVSLTNAYVTGRCIWRMPDDANNDTFGRPISESQEAAAANREALQRQDALRRQRRHNRANQNRQPGQDREPRTFADVARAMGLG